MIRTHGLKLDFGNCQLQTRLLGGKVPEGPVVVRQCRAEEDAAEQFCGQEHVTRIDVPACPSSPAVLGMELDSFEVSK